MMASTACRRRWRTLCTTRPNACFKTKKSEGGNAFGAINCNLNFASLEMLRSFIVSCLLVVSGMFCLSTPCRARMSAPPLDPCGTSQAPQSGSFFFPHWASAFERQQNRASSRFRTVATNTTANARRRMLYRKGSCPACAHAHTARSI